jgi:outer membrane protein OmpA-like peptidoglycan-associated protein
VVNTGPSARDLLDTERARLSELFRGTPVIFLTTSEGNLRVTVPRQYCFDPGATVVKPALAAVLVRVAKSQVNTDSHFRLAAPTDPGTRHAALATDRALSVRDWLAAHGIAPARIQAGGATQSEQVELFVVPQPPM